VFCATKGKKQNQEQETATHLVLHCSFGKYVWGRIRAWPAGLIEVPDQEQEVMEWWQELAKLPRKTRHTKAVILIFNLWKSFFYR